MRWFFKKYRKLLSLHHAYRSIILEGGTTSKNRKEMQPKGENMSFDNEVHHFDGKFSSNVVRFCLIPS